MMDQPKILFTGELKDLKTALGRIDQGFKGVLRCTGKSGGQVYEADVLIRDSLIIAASRRNIENNETVYGKQAYKEILECTKNKAGKLELYSLTDEEFKAIVEEEEDILLEEVKDLSSLVPQEESGKNPEPEEELEKEWDKLEDEFEELDKKDAPFFEGMLSEDKGKNDSVKETEKPLSFEIIREEAKELKDEGPRGIEEPSLSNKETGKEPASGTLAPSLTGIVKETLPPEETKPEQVHEADEPIEPPKEKEEVPAPAQTQNPPAAEEPKESILDKTSQEIAQLKKNVEVYWGWDEKKKKFVGRELAPGEKRPEPAPETPKPRPPVEQKPVPVQTDEEKKEAAMVPVLARKINFRDKLFYLTTPKVIRVLERIDGKKTLGGISGEMGISLDEAKYIIEQLRKDGYLNR